MELAKTDCPTCSGLGRFDCSGPGHSRLTHHEACPTCSGEGSVYVCPSCETSYTVDSGDGESIEHAGQCRWCVQYDAAHPEAA
jgi:DnaJ-class molecular chaperone